MTNYFYSILNPEALLQIIDLRLIFPGFQCLCPFLNIDFSELFPSFAGLHYKFLDGISFFRKKLLEFFTFVDEYFRKLVDLEL